MTEPAEDIPGASIDGPTDDNHFVEGVAARLHLRVNGEEHAISVTKGQTLLDAVRGAGLEPPFSCQKGVCGACLAKLVVGKVYQHATSALDANQIDNDLILTCQSVATSELVAIDYG